MTESEFEKIEEFKTLPIYDENSPYCRKIERPSDVKYTGEIIEVTTIEEAYDLIKHEEYSAKGAIRYHNERQPIIRVIFWRAR